MIFILDRQERIINILKNNGGTEFSPFFDDVLTEDLTTGGETFQFSTIANRSTSKDLVVGNFVAFKKDSKIKLFQIMQVEESHEEVIYTNVYCESAGLELINKIFRKTTINSATLRKFMETVLSDTGWNVGMLEAGVLHTLDLEIEEATVYSVLQNVIKQFECELEFRVEINNGRIASKFVDVYKSRGKVTGKRFVFGQDIEGIVRKTDFTNFYTALIGSGKNGITFKDITVDGIDKPLGQDFVADQEAFEKYNHNGYHIMGKFEFDTTSPEELLRETYKKLQEVKEVRYEYEVSVSLLGRLLGEKWNDVAIGDTVAIVDNAFNPPINLMARVSKLETSKTNPQGDTCTLTNFIEVASNISDEMRKVASELEGYVDSRFPIKEEDISNGAVTGDKISNAYTQTLTTDILHAGQVITEKLISDYAEITDAKIENLKAENVQIGNAIIENAEITNAKIESLEAKDGYIENLVSKKANIEDLNSINATIENLKVKDADIENAIIDNAEITFAKIDQLEANVGKIDSVISGNISSGNIQTGGITGDNLNMETIFVRDANILDLSASKLTAGEINTSQIVITSEDGGMRLVGSTQQFVDENNRIRIQLGKDAEGDFDFYILAENGDILFNTRGITGNAIENGLIKENMVADSAIGGKKINWQSFTTEFNKSSNTHKLNSSKVLLDGTNQTLDVHFNRLKSTVDDNVSQTESNTTQLNVHQGKINTLIQDTTITKDGQNVKLKDEYSKLEQTVGGLKSSIGQQQTTINQNTGKITATESKVSTLEQTVNGFNSELSHVKTTIDEQEEAINSVNSALSGKANSNDVYKKSETMTTSAINSAINQSADSIKLGISETYETKTNVETKVTTTLNSAKTYADTKKQEAINSASTDATNKVNSAKNELNTAINKKANSTDVYTKTETYTKSETDSKIKVAKDSIELGVSQNYETKTNVETKVNNAINNIQIGGRNITPNTNFYKGIEGWGTWNGAGSMSIVSGRTSSMKALQLVLANQNGSGYRTPTVSCIGGKKYTVSFWFKSTISCRVGDLIKFRDANGSESNPISMATVSVPANAWTYYTFTFTSPSSAVQIYTTPRVETAVGTPTVQLTEYKLEEGTKASSWTPAPEDVDSAIGSKANSSDVYTKAEVYTKAQTDSAINVAKDNITLSVSQNYETKSNVTNKINTAKTEAVNTSKSYADTKKNEAISSASTDATNKVNSAKNELNTAINKKANSSDVYTKSQVYTKEETNSQIKVAKDEINLGVSNTYETKTNVETKVNNAVSGIKVGGDNVLRNGNFAYNMSDWSIHDMSSGGTSKSVTVENGGGDWKPANKKVLVIRGINTTNRYGVISSTMKLIPNTKYTISGYCAGHRVNKIQVNVRDKQNGDGNIHTININPVTGGSTLDKWYRFETTFTTTSNTDFALNLYSVNFADNGYVWFTDVQVQEGTKATTWTPCSEDINSSINSKANASDVYNKTEVYTKAETNSQINVAKNEINLGVSSTYETKTNVETKVNNAVNNIQVGGRNLALETSNNYSTAYSNFNGSTNTCPALAKVLTDGLKVGDTVTVRLLYKYTNIVATSGQTAKCWMQGNGNVTAWNSGAFHSSPQKAISGSGEHEFKYSFTVIADHLKNEFWNTSIRHDYVQSGSVQWKLLKIERGNKATDWTPAPEDLEKSIELVERRVETAEQKITPTAIINTVSQQLGADGKLQNSIMKFDKNGLEVSHSEANTRTQMNSKGFFIYNSQGETVGSLATETGLSVVNTNKVYADNIRNIYEGDGTLYVNHNYTGDSDGTSSRPFKTFADLRTYLEVTPIINKDVTVNIVSTSEITEPLVMDNLSGRGTLKFQYAKTCIHRTNSTHMWCISMANINLPLQIHGGRSSYNTSDGAILCDNGNQHGIKLVNCPNFYIGSIAINCKNWGIHLSNCQGTTSNVDFCKTYCAFELRDRSHVYDSDACGNCGDFFRVFTGSIFVYGSNGGGYRPYGNKIENSGRYLLVGAERTQTNSFRTPPPAPTTSDQYGTWSMRDYGYFTYGRNGVNVNSWNPGSKRIQQGEWSGYGNNYGFAFFDDSNIRSWLANGTPKDGSTITLKRASSGGYSSSQPVYLCGATNTSCSGTPSGVKSYGKIGSLAWGETKTFNIPTSFVNDLKSGAIKSVCFYDSSGASYVKIDSVSIKLKANKPV